MRFQCRQVKETVQVTAAWMIKVFGGLAGSFQKLKFWKKRAQGRKGLSLHCSNMVAVGHMESYGELEIWFVHIKMCCKCGIHFLFFSCLHGPFIYSVHPRTLQAILSNKNFIKLSTLGQAVGKVTQFFEPHIKHWLGELHQT